MLCNNIKNLIIIFCFFATHFCVAPEITENEFVQPKKGHKRVSVTTHKEHNIEALSSISIKSSSCVERLGRFQKNIPQGVNTILKQDSRTYHEQAEQNLIQINDCLERVEDLLAVCEKCIVNVIP